ncbi:fungal pheromone mating factor STE2 GPCR-domain-containing protein [Neohortaea acidophila]|uniref:Fungal pheromone mating factor STE2 GPCR-domain-containing protein n=1 Tax=Neohortaea acidophila TaxID=245834 RepID=A0A6A6PVB5_9PEZI|nr:fungal pheromone mating factor STE2 GPCR-domain-containing protein [Neohortaea acidophila]KAF2483932.1 fungal pheromone mating factor STE2 GPCR-domain-containing protein [Neohortaea acidophila]
MATFEWHVNKTFDPFTQNFTVLGPDGVTPVQVSMSLVRSLQSLITADAIYSGIMIGSAVFLLLALLLITKPDKRRSLIFILNAVALVLVITRGIVSSVVFSGTFYNWYRLQTYYYGGDIAPAQAASFAGELIDFMLVSTLELSMVLQVRIVCCTLDAVWRNTINIINIAMALAEVGTRFALMILVTDWNILHVGQETEQQFRLLGKLGQATDIVFVVNIAIAAIIFCAKLGLAIRSRRSMGMTKFGPMQIIFIMACQTMLTPLIFILVALYGYKNHNLQIMIPTIIALSLPLSAMWATVKTDHVHIANPRHYMRALPGGAADLSGAKACGTATTDTTDTLIDSEDTASLSTPKGKSTRDVEMQKLKGGVHVDRTYSVRCD